MVFNVVTIVEFVLYSIPLRVMTGRFSELMALSASHTREAGQTAKQLLEERKRKEEQRLKEQMEKDRKEQEIQRRLVQAKMEEQRREREKQERAEEEKRRKELLIQKREEEQRTALLYGPKASKASGSANGSRTRKAANDSDNGFDSGAMALTREEKRQRKLMADLNRGAKQRKAHGSSSNHRSNGRLLKGGAVDDVPISAPINYSELPNDQNLSIKERIAAMPNNLIRLNTQKRDTRTIDEILRDRAKAREAKVLAGEDAKAFNDWFGKGKKSEANAKDSNSAQSSVSPAPPSRPLTPIPAAGTKSTAPLARQPQSIPRLSTLSHLDSAKDLGKKVSFSRGQLKSSLPTSKQSTSSKAATSLSPSKTNGLTKKDSSVSLSKSSISHNHSAASPKKRRRSDSLDSLSPSPPPSRKRKDSGPSSQRAEISATIWKIFGRNKSDYEGVDVYSDEEDDMEVNAAELRREELRRYDAIHSRLTFWMMLTLVCLLVRDSLKERMNLPLKRRDVTKRISAGRRKRKSDESGNSRTRAVMICKDSSTSSALFPFRFTTLSISRLWIFLTASTTIINLNLRKLLPCC